jgi:hypothetical protein
MRLGKIFVSIILIILLVNSVTALLDADYTEKCKKDDFLLENSDYVVEGKVSKIEVKWHKNNINTYQYFQINKYIKGEKLDDDLLIIDSLGGCVGDMCQHVEDGNPILESNKEYNLYLSSKEEYFSIYCMGYGVKLKTESEKDVVEPIFDKDTEIPITDKDEVEPIEDKDKIEPIQDKDVVEPVADKDETEPLEDKDKIEIIADKDIVGPIEVQISTT